MQEKINNLLDNHVVANIGKANEFKTSLLAIKKLIDGGLKELDSLFVKSSELVNAVEQVKQENQSNSSNENNQA